MTEPSLISPSHPRQSGPGPRSSSSKDTVDNIGNRRGRRRNIQREETRRNVATADYCWLYACGTSPHWRITLCNLVVWTLAFSGHAKFPLCPVLTSVETADVYQPNAGATIQAIGNSVKFQWVMLPRFKWITKKSFYASDYPRFEINGHWLLLWSPLDVLMMIMQSEDGPERWIIAANNEQCASHWSCKKLANQIKRNPSNLPCCSSMLHRLATAFDVW